MNPTIDTPTRDEKAGSKGRFLVRLTDPDHERLRIAAFEDRVAMTDLTREGLEVVHHVRDLAAKTGKTRSQVLEEVFALYERQIAAGRRLR